MSTSVKYQQRKRRRPNDSNFDFFCVYLNVLIMEVLVWMLFMARVPCATVEISTIIATPLTIESEIALLDENPWLDGNNIKRPCSVNEIPSFLLPHRQCITPIHNQRLAIDILVAGQ
jgi:hypothetical protein